MKNLTRVNMSRRVACGHQFHEFAASKFELVEITPASTFNYSARGTDDAQWRNLVEARPADLVAKLLSTKPANIFEL